RCRIGSDDEVYSGRRNWGVTMGATRIGRSEAAGLGLGTVGRVSSNDIGMKGRARGVRAWQLWLPAALCLLVIGIEQFHVLAIRATTLLARDRQAQRGRRPLLMMVGASLVAAGLAELGGLAFRPLLLGGGGVARHGIGAALAHPLGLVLAVSATTVLLVAAVR